MNFRRVLLALVATCVGLAAAFPFSKNSGVVELTPKTINAFLNTHKPVFLMFYAPWCGHCKSLHPDWEKFGQSVKDVVRVGAINADQYREIGSQYGVQGFPTIKYWKMGEKKGGPSDFQGQRNHGALHNAALREITPAGVSVATSLDTIQKAIEKASEKKVVVLFSSKMKSPPMFSVMSQSKHFKGKVGFVLAMEKTKDISSQFDVTSFPTIMVVSQNSEGGFDKVVYDGKVEYTGIAKWLQKVLGQVPSEEEGGAAAGTPSASKAKQPSAEQDAPATDETKEAAAAAKNKKNDTEAAAPVRSGRRATPDAPLPLSKADFDAFCKNGSPKVRGQQPFCVIAMQESNIDLASMHAAFEKESVLFFHVPADMRSTWMQDLQDGLQPAHNNLDPKDVIVLRAASDRTKFAIWRRVDGEAHGHPDTFHDFLARCLGGDMTFERNPGWPKLREDKA